MKLTLEIDLANAWGSSGTAEISRLLGDVLQKIYNNCSWGAILDADGDRVGSWGIEE